MHGNLIFLSIALALVGFILYAWNSAGRDFVIFSLMDIQRDKSIRLDPEVESLQKKFHRAAALERVTFAALVSFFILSFTFAAAALACLLLAVFRLVFEPRLNKLRGRDCWHVGETAETDKLIRRIAIRLFFFKLFGQYLFNGVSSNQVSKILSIAAVLLCAGIFLIALHFSGLAPDLKNLLQWN